MSTMEQVQRTQEGLREQLGRIREEASRVEQEARFDSSMPPSGGSQDATTLQDWTAIRYVSEAFGQQQKDRIDGFVATIRERADRAQQSHYAGGVITPQATARTAALVREVLDVTEQLVVAQASLLQEIERASSSK